MRGERRAGGAAHLSVECDVHGLVGEQRVDEPVAEERDRVDAAQLRVQRVALGRRPARVGRRPLVSVEHALGAHRRDDRDEVGHVVGLQREAAADLGELADERAPLLLGDG